MAEITEDEILEEIHRLGVQKDEIREEQRRLHRQLDGVRARRKIAEMPDAERQALLQVVETQGVASVEAVQ